MKVFFDECVPRPLRKLLATHEIKTAQELEWGRLKNGALIAHAEQAGFDVFVTSDQNLKYQQNLQRNKIALLVLSTNFWPVLRVFLFSHSLTSDRKVLRCRMNPEDQLKTAKDLRQKGNHAEALQIAQAVAAFYPDNADAWWVAGLAAQSLKKLPESLASLKETIKLAPRWAPGWAQYGIVLDENGQKEEGKKALCQAIKIKPDHVFAHRQLARIFKQEENFDGQILHLTRLDDLGEADGDDMNLLGIAHWRKKHFANAIEYYLRSAKLGAGPYPYFNLALVYSHAEVSQDVDATDSLHRALADTADYQPAIKKLSELKPRLIGLAREVLKHGETLLHLGECFQFYLNPLEMVGFDRDQDIDELDTKRIQRLKKTVLQEIDLEDGALQSLDGFTVDKSRAIGLCEELLDEKLRRYHWQVFQNPFLLWFITRGDIRHFLHSESSFPLATLEALDEDEFRQWLSEPFARQYDLVLSRAIERRVVRMVESLFDGRRWVVREHDDICFAGAHRHIERLLEPLRNAAQRAKETEPQLAAIQDLLARNRLVEILDLLPMYFRDQQSEAVRHIRDMAIATYNAHDNADLSKAILLLSKKFAFKSTELCQRLDDDFKKIDELIKEERKHEAKLTLGDKPMEVTKDGIRQGERFLPVTHIRSIRWGIAVTGYQHAPTYEFLMAFRDDELSEVIFSWSSSNNLEQQEKHFQKLVEAALTYIVPSIVVKVQQQFERREQVRVGTCTMKREGVVFDTPGWFSAKTNLVPWSQVKTDLEMGRLSVYDCANPKTRITMPLREAENAVVLRFLSSAKK